MADVPSTGDTDWGTKMNAHLAIGHNTDGTHNQEDWTPSTMAGASDSDGTVTFPNGLIWKWGKETWTGIDTTVTFAAAFPTACFQAIACGGLTTGNLGADVQSHTIAAASFVIRANANTGSPMRWFAVGR